MKIQTRRGAPVTAATLCACAFGLMAALLGGCGGGGNGSNAGFSAPPPLGDQAFRAAAIASDQSLAGTVSFPLAMLKSTAPKGSAATRAAAFTRPGTLAAQLTARSTRAGGTRAGGITLNTLLGLYALDPIVTGNAMVTQFFLDPAGTRSAGSITLVKQGVSNFSDDYRSYPATADGIVNLTAGNVPFHGHVNILYATAAGANTMTGHLDQSRSGVGIDLNLALSDALNVTGSAVIQENGQTIHVTEINGPLAGKLSCKVNITPQGWAGVADFSLVNDTFSMTVHDGSGTDTARTDATGNLNMTYADGQTEVIHDPLHAALVGAVGSNPGDFPDGKAGFFNAPIAVGGRINGINASGQMVGELGYYASPTSAPQPVPTPPGATVSLSAISASGQITGFIPGPNGNPFAGPVLFWQTPTSQPIALKVFAPGNLNRALSINSHGQMFGMCAGLLNGVYQVNPIYWADASSMPRVLPLTFSYTTGPSTVGPYDPSNAFTIADDGTMLVKFISDSHVVSAVFQAPASASDSIQSDQTILKHLPDDYAFDVEALSANGMLVGTTTGTKVHRVLWANASAAPQVLPDIATTDVRSFSAINNSGTAVGSFSKDGITYVPVMFKDGKAVDINTLLPAGTTDTFSLALLINDAGVVVVAKGYPGAATQYAVLVPR